MTDKMITDIIIKLHWAKMLAHCQHYTQPYCLTNYN